MSQRREVSAVLTLSSSVGTLTDVSVKTSFSETRTKAAKIIKRSNKFRNRNELRKVQQCCQRKVAETFKWYKTGAHTWWMEINRGNRRYVKSDTGRNPELQRNKWAWNELNTVLPVCAAVHDISCSSAKWRKPVRFLKAKRNETELCRGLSWLNTVAPVQNCAKALF
jgi:hypothetical protein